MNIMQMMMGACAAKVTWANWNESSQSALASDNIFVCLMDAPNAGDNETGEGGGLSGADLVLTQLGNLAGASGGYRSFDGSDDRLDMTANAVNTLIANANNTWSIILKVDNIASNGDFIYFKDTAATEGINLYHNNNAHKYDNAIEQDNVIEYAVPTGLISASTVYYVCAWADGTDCRVGFTTTRPTKWSDFAANDRVILSTNTGAYSGENFDSYQTIGYGSVFLDFDLAYVVMAKTCLIDNDS